MSGIGSGSSARDASTRHRSRAALQQLAQLDLVGAAELRDLGAPDEDYASGDVVQFPTPDGAGAFAGMVRELGDDWLLFDFNHPLAGQAVSFEVQLIGVL